MKVKLFGIIIPDHELSYDDFENRINNWLLANPLVEVKEIKINTTFCDFKISVICMVLYEPGDN